MKDKDLKKFLHDYPPVSTDLARQILAHPQAVAGEARIVMCNAANVRDVNRTMLGGVVLENFCNSDSWTMAHGSLIFLPRTWYDMDPKGNHSMRGARLDQHITEMSAVYDPHHERGKDQYYIWKERK